MDLLLQNDALGPRAGPSAQGGYLKIRQRMQTADWQFWFSDRFTGARNPARLPTLDAIPSNPLRPLSGTILAGGIHFGLTPSPSLSALAWSGVPACERDGSTGQLGLAPRTSL